MTVAMTTARGVCAQALRQRHRDGNHQRRGGSVGHKVGHCAGDDKDDDQQDQRVDFVAHGSNQRISNQAARAGMLQRRCQCQRTAKKEHGLEVDGLQCLFFR